MKKVFSIVAGLALVASLASCKKDHTCTCKTNVAGIETESKDTIKETKKKAKEACESANMSTELMGIKTEVKCSLD